jgi:cell wall-associated NlpC family hydrolase
MPNNHADTTRPSVGGEHRRWRASRILTAAGLAAAVGVALPITSATADQKPSTLAGAKAQLSNLYNQTEELDNQIDLTESNIKIAQHQVGIMKNAVSAEQTNYNQMHSALAQFATQAYEQGNMTSLPNLVSAKNPQSVLDQMSVFTQQAVNRSATLTQFVSAAQRLLWQQDQATSAVESLHQLQGQLKNERQSSNADVARTTKLIDQLGGKYLVPGTTSYQACTAFAVGRIAPVIDYACSKLGNAYVFGAAGPVNFDCSGLTMMAWKQVGVSLYHYVPNQQAETVPISASELRPGALLFWNSDDHVTMYLGNDMMISAPHTGTDVQVQRMSTYSGTSAGYGMPAGW